MIKYGKMPTSFLHTVQLNLRRKCDASGIVFTMGETTLFCSIFPYFRLLLVVSLLGTSLLHGQVYYRSEESKELVQKKIYPKQGKLEITLPDIGIVLNEAFIDSTVFHAGVIYHLSETWGLGLEGIYSSNQDKPERYCVENFYNDPLNLLPVACPSTGEDPTKYLYDSAGKPIKGAKLGPAYMPIRELEGVALATVTWSPFYGKQLALFSKTIYFDLFMSFGGGLSFSTFYPESPYLRNGNLSRGLDKAPIPLTGCPPDGANFPGICPTSPNLLQNIGTGGRPPAASEALPTLSLGIGQKFHFKGRFNFHIELRDLAFYSANTQFTNLFMIWGGLGMRI